MPFRPNYPGEFPSLGWLCLDWIAENLAAPDRANYEPFIPTPEQARFIVNLLRVDATGRGYRHRRAVISRPRGWGKSPLLASLCAYFALAESVIPDGFDAYGRPVGRPLADVRTPLVQLAAVTEQQTSNSWTPLLEMLREGPVIDNYPGLEPLDTFVILPRGRIERITSSSSSVKGARCFAAVLDQTEEWTSSNGGIRLAETMRNNAAKINGITIESPNAYTPGMGSVAEKSAAFYKDIIEGRAKDDGLHYDHREAPPETDPSDEASLLAGLRYAYGDSADSAGGWVDLSRLAREANDLGTDPQVYRSDFLNQITHASDSWLSHPEVAAIADPSKVVRPGEMITMGFDGSRGRTTRGKVADSTALMGCRVSDGHLFPIGIWEQPPGPAGEGWEPPAAEVDAAVRSAFETYNVVGFYADPALWEGRVDDWEGAFSRRLKVRATGAHPIRWLMNRGLLVVRATARLHTAFVSHEITHDGSYALVRHFVNARRRVGRHGVQISKANPESAAKIDIAVASILAFEARADAIAAGLSQKQQRYVPKRIW